MKIGIAGPLATADIEHLLDGDTSRLPREMKGATLLISLIEALLREGHEVAAFTTDPELVPRRDNLVIARGNRFAVYYVPRRRHALRSDRGSRGRMLDLFALERKALEDAIRVARPDIVHAHWTYEFGAAAMASGLPHLITCHDSPWAILKTQRDLYRLGRYLMARFVLSRSSHLTVVSPYLLNELRGLVKVPLKVVPNPLSDAIFAAGKARLVADFHGRPPRIAMLLNGWSSLKNPEAGMKAMGAIRAAFPGAVMHLYGPGYGPGEQAQHWAKEHGSSEAFAFHGWIPHAQAMRELATMDILVHPAVEESFGMTIAEAMALGLPVVAGAKSGAVPWVLGESRGGGLLVDVMSPAAISEAVKMLLGNKDLYTACSRSGRERAMAHFSANEVAKAYLDIYGDVLGHGVVRPSDALIGTGR